MEKYRFFHIPSKTWDQHKAIAPNIFAVYNDSKAFILPDEKEYHICRYIERDDINGLETYSGHIIETIEDKPFRGVVFKCIKHCGYRVTKDLKNIDESLPVPNKYKIIAHILDKPSALKES